VRWGGEDRQGCQVQKFKEAKFDHMQFQKRPNPKKLKKAK